jgi:hypothetical protein
MLSAELPNGTNRLWICIPASNMLVRCRRNFDDRCDLTRDAVEPDHPDAPHGASRRRHLCVTGGPEL